MERVDNFQTIKVDHCTLFNVLRSVTIDIKFHTTFPNVRIRIGEIVHKIAQKCDEHIYEES